MKYTRFALTIIACLYFWRCVQTYYDWHFIDSVNLIFHEAGHTIFSFFGNFIHVAAGSGFQVALPLLIAVYFFVQKQKISGSICLMWTGQSLLNVSIYAGDAIKMDLPLLGGDSSMHDWNYLLNTLNIMKYTDQVAKIIYFSGIIFIVIGTILSLYYAWISENKL